MSTLAEIEAAVPSLTAEELAELERLVQKAKQEKTALGLRSTIARPDFLARQEEIFGGRTLPDSQAVLDEIRADRF